MLADSVRIAERARDLIRVEYELLDAVFDPEEARAPGAPLLHPHRTPADRVDEAGRNVIAAIHAGSPDIEEVLAASTTTVRGEWHTQRVTHVALETHAARGWIDDRGRIVVRTSSQVPWLVRDELCRLFSLEKDRVRVLAARVGGGFGGKQELLTEDLVVASVLATGRPAQYEFTREETFRTAPMRHPMRVGVRVGADAEGRLTALAVDVLSDTGAYGNHSRGVLFHSVGESIAVYRCPVKRVDAEVVYTNNPPSGAFRGYGLGQIVFADRVGARRPGARARPRPGGTAAAQRRAARRSARRRRPRRGVRPALRQLRARPVPRPRGRGARARSPRDGAAGRP